MARTQSRPLTPDVHALALADARAHGRVAVARRYGIGVATLERALAWARLSPLALRAIEHGVTAPPSGNHNAALGATG